MKKKIKEVLKYLAPILIVVFGISLTLYITYMTNLDKFYGKKITEVVLDVVFLRKYAQILLGLFLFILLMLLRVQSKREKEEKRYQERQDVVIKELINENNSMKEILNSLRIGYKINEASDIERLKHDQVIEDINKFLDTRLYESAKETKMFKK
jgi:hypothetical protein